MTIWQSTIETTRTALLSGLVVLAIIVVFNLSRRYPVGNRIYAALLSRTKLGIILLVFLILLMPVMLSLFKGLPLSPKVLAEYARELLISVVVVLSAGITWKVLDRVPLKSRRQAKPYVQPLVTKLQPSTASGIQVGMSLNEAFLALDSGDIDPGMAKERLQLYLLDKWMQGKDAGFYELQETVRYNGGLRPAVKTRLEYLRQAHPEKLTRLQLLLS
jgi:hypothetical protein